MKTKLRPKCSVCKKELVSGKKYYFDGRNDIYCSMKCWWYEIKMLHKKVEKLELSKGISKHNITITEV